MLIDTHQNLSGFLKAMDLGTPVIARRNDGNEALIQHGVTGFLFSSPEV